MVNFETNKLLKQPIKMADYKLLFFSRSSFQENVSRFEKQVQSKIVILLQISTQFLLYTSPF